MPTGVVQAHVTERERNHSREPCASLGTVLTIVDRSGSSTSAQFSYRALSGPQVLVTPSTGSTGFIPGSQELREPGRHPQITRYRRCNQSVLTVIQVGLYVQNPPLHPIRSGLSEGGGAKISYISGPAEFKPVKPSAAPRCEQ